MTLQDFIYAAYTAQNDAGSLENFTRKFHEAKAMTEDHAADPVAVFLAAVIHENPGSLIDAVEALDFFTGELLRAVQSLQKAAAD